MFSYDLRNFTPEEAAYVIKNLNTSNRYISPNHVEMLARDMKSGKWRDNGDPVRFMTDGSLGDGQHRLAACARANVPITVLVVSGLTKEDMLTVDRGRIRSIGDMLAIAHGVRNGRHVA